MLEIFRKQLRHPEGTSGALWTLAQLDLQENRLTDALSRLTEAYAIVDRLDHALGIANIGPVLGQLAATGGQHELAIVVLKRSRDVLRRIGHEETAVEVDSLIQEVEGRS